MINLLLSLLIIISCSVANKPVMAADVPTFEGSIGAPGPRQLPTQGNKFNKFMLKHRGKIVYLFVFLDEEQRRDFAAGLAKPDEYNRIIFTVSDDYLKKPTDSTGCEYLIHLPAKARDYKFEYLKQAGRLSGYFKIWDINGPRQGYMSINLRAVAKPGCVSP